MQVCIGAGVQLVSIPHGCRTEGAICISVVVVLPAIVALRSAALPGPCHQRLVSPAHPPVLYVRMFAGSCSLSPGTGGIRDLGALGQPAIQDLRAWEEGRGRPRAAVQEAGADGHAERADGGFVGEGETLQRLKEMGHEK